MYFPDFYFGANNPEHPDLECDPNAYFGKAYSSHKYRVPSAQHPMQSALDYVWAGANPGAWTPLAGYTGAPAAPYLSPARAAPFVRTVPMQNSLGYQIQLVQDNGVPVAGTPATTPQYVKAGPIQASYMGATQAVLERSQFPRGRLPTVLDIQRTEASARYGACGGGPQGWPFVAKPPGFEVVGFREGWPVYGYAPAGPPQQVQEVVRRERQENPDPLLLAGLGGALLGGATGYATYPKPPAPTPPRPITRVGLTPQHAARLQTQTPPASRPYTGRPHQGSGLQGLTMTLQSVQAQNPSTNIPYGVQTQGWKWGTVGVASVPFYPPAPRAPSGDPMNYGTYNPTAINPASLRHRRAAMARREEVLPGFFSRSFTPEGTQLAQHRGQGPALGTPGMAAVQQYAMPQGQLVTGSEAVQQRAFPAGLHYAQNPMPGVEYSGYQRNVQVNPGTGEVRIPARHPASGAQQNPLAVNPKDILAMCQVCTPDGCRWVPCDTKSQRGGRIQATRPSKPAFLTPRWSGFRSHNRTTGPRLINPDACCDSCAVGGPCGGLKNNPGGCGRPGGCNCKG